MKNLEFSAVEKEMMNFNFDELKNTTEKAKAKIASAASVADVKTEICNIWNKVRKYVIWAEAIPVAGKFISLLADVLDSLCGTN